MDGEARLGALGRKLDRDDLTGDDLDLADVGDRFDGRELKAVPSRPETEASSCGRRLDGAPVDEDFGCGGTREDAHEAGPVLERDHPLLKLGMRAAAGELGHARVMGRVELIGLLERFHQERGEAGARGERVRPPQAIDRRHDVPGELPGLVDEASRLVELGGCRLAPRRTRGGDLAGLRLGPRRDAHRRQDTSDQRRTPRQDRSLVFGVLCCVDSRGGPGR